jgi:hypothetical protein
MVTWDSTIGFFFLLWGFFFFLGWLLALELPGEVLDVEGVLLELLSVDLDLFVLLLCFCFFLGRAFSPVVPAAGSSPWYLGGGDQDLGSSQYLGSSWFWVLRLLSGLEVLGLPLADFFLVLDALGGLGVLSLQVAISLWILDVLGGHGVLSPHLAISFWNLDVLSGPGVLGLRLASYWGLEILIGLWSWTGLGVLDGLQVWENEQVWDLPLVLPRATCPCPGY